MIHSYLEVICYNQGCYSFFHQGNTILVEALVAEWECRNNQFQMKAYLDQGVQPGHKEIGKFDF
jgi:hypothetical protein